MLFRYAPGRGGVHAERLQLIQYEGLTTGAPAVWLAAVNIIANNQALSPRRGRRPTAEHVLRVLLPALDPAADWQLVGPMQRSRQAHVFRARAPGRDGDVAVKVYHVLLHPQQTRWQHEALEATFAAMRDPRFTAPRPLGWLKDEHTLFMEWIDGRPLSSALWSWKLVPDRRRLALLSDAGAWLRRYHEAIGVTVKPFDPDLVLRWIDQPFAADPGLARFMMADRVFAEALARLRAAASGLAGEPLPHTAIHGDFTPYNLLDSGDRLVGIDILALHDQPVFSDISRFLIYVDVRKYVMTLGFQMNPLGIRAADAAAFLGGYGMSLADAASPVIAVVHLAEVVRRWARVGEKLRSGRRVSLWRHEAWRMRRMTAHIVARRDPLLS